MVEPLILNISKEENKMKKEYLKLTYPKKKIKLKCIGEDNVEGLLDELCHYFDLVDKNEYKFFYSYGDGGNRYKDLKKCLHCKINNIFDEILSDINIRIEKIKTIKIKEKSTFLQSHKPKEIRTCLELIDKLINKTKYLKISKDSDIYGSNFRNILIPMLLINFKVKTNYQNIQYSLYFYKESIFLPDIIETHSYSFNIKSIFALCYFLLKLSEDNIHKISIENLEILFRITEETQDENIFSLPCFYITNLSLTFYSLHAVSEFIKKFPKNIFKVKNLTIKIKNLPELYENKTTSYLSIYDLVELLHFFSPSFNLINLFLNLNCKTRFVFFSDSHLKIFEKFLFKSIKLKDNLYSLSKEEGYIHILQFIVKYVNLSFLQKLYISNLKINRQDSLKCLLKSIWELNKQNAILSLTMKNIKTDLKEIKNQIVLNSSGISFKMLQKGKEKFHNMDSLKKIKIENSEMVNIENFPMLPEILLGKNIKIDKNSFICFNGKEYFIDLLNKKGPILEINFNENLLEEYFENGVDIPRNINKIALTRLNLTDDFSSRQNFQIIGTIFTKKTLLNISKFKIKNCLFNSSSGEILNQSLNDYLNNRILSKLIIKNWSGLSLTRVTQQFSLEKLSLENCHFQIDDKDSKINQIKQVKIDIGNLSSLLCINKIPLPTLKEIDHRISILLKQNGVETLIIKNMTKEEFNFLSTISTIKNITCKSCLNISFLQSLLIPLKKLKLVNIEDRIIDRNENFSAAESMKKPENQFLCRLLDLKYKFQCIYLDYITLCSQLFDEPLFPNFLTYLSLKDLQQKSEEKEQLQRINGNSFLKNLLILAEEKKVVIYYKNKEELNLIIMLFNVFCFGDRTKGNVNVVNFILKFLRKDDKSSTFFSVNKFGYFDQPLIDTVRKLHFKKKK
jgi:hypothetical protein